MGYQMGFRGTGSGCRIRFGRGSGRRWGRGCHRRRRPRWPGCRATQAGSGPETPATRPIVSITTLGTRRTSRRCFGRRCVRGRPRRRRRWPLACRNTVLGAGARLLGRQPSMICRERPRGATNCGYRARITQDAAEAARARPKPRKLETNPALRGEVVQRLQQRHSPDQIAARLREDFPRRSRDVGVTRDDLSGPVCPAPQGAGPPGQGRAAHRTGTTKK